MSKPRSHYAWERNRHLMAETAGEDDLFGILTEDGEPIATETLVALQTEQEQA